MKPTRRTYTVMARTWYDMLRPVLRFRTALDLDTFPGIKIRLKQLVGGKVIRLERGVRGEH